MDKKMEVRVLLKPEEKIKLIKAIRDSKYMTVSDYLRHCIYNLTEGDLNE